MNKKTRGLTFIYRGLIVLTILLLGFGIGVIYSVVKVEKYLELNDVCMSSADAYRVLSCYVGNVSACLDPHYWKTTYDTRVDTSLAFPDVPYWDDEACKKMTGREEAIYVLEDNKSSCYFSNIINYSEVGGTEGATI